MVVERLDRRTHGELVRLETRCHRAEEREAWTRARTLGHRIHLAVVADRPDVAHDAAGAIVTLADRRLRQIGGNDAA